MAEQRSSNKVQSCFLGFLAIDVGDRSDLSAVEEKFSRLKTFARSARDQCWPWRLHQTTTREISTTKRIIHCERNG